MELYHRGKEAGYVDVDYCIMLSIRMVEALLRGRGYSGEGGSADSTDTLFIKCTDSAAYVQESSVEKAVARVGGSP